MEVVDIIREVELQQQEQHQAEEEEEEEEQHFHVLAVDDSVIDRKLLERLLRSSSYKVTCVDSGDKALKYLGLIDDDLDNHSSSHSSIQSSSPPQPLHQEGGIKVNLIMTDYCMPGMSGYDLLKRVKGSSWKDVPVVVMSSENVPSRINMCLEGGADEFLLKPLQLADMEKLQPYLLKSSSSLDINSCDDGNSSTDSDTENLISNNNNSTISKRKAMSPAEPIERSRPKMKGLEVV